MNWTHVSFDWNHARAFLATVEEGTLSAAARALGVTQPTLGRQVAALEEELGVTLFERVGRGLDPTPTGRSLAAHVAAMRDAAARVSLSAAGQIQTIDGRIAITASAIYSAHSLPPILAALRERAPNLRVDVVADDALRDIQRREADIAIRHVRPEAPDLIARKLLDAKGQFVASDIYLDRRGTPSTLADLASHDFIAYGSPKLFTDFLRPRGVPVTEDHFRITSEDSLVGFELVKQGFGISVLDSALIARTPGLRPLLADKLEFDFPVWLTTHKELHTSRKIRLVFDLMAELIPTTLNAYRNGGLNA
ncbi:MAG: LysR family transcriptional regulator [Pseudomonadota bacterium]